MPEQIHLDTEAQIVEAMAWALDRELELESGQLLCVDDQRRVLRLLHRALFRITPRVVTLEIDDRDIPQWLIDICQAAPAASVSEEENFDARR